MFAAFERLVPPYPDGVPPLPPRGFLPFVWACSFGLRRYIALMTLLTAAIGVFDFAGTILSGWLSDRYDNRWLLF